jgi:hypothetical protein
MKCYKAVVTSHDPDVFNSFSVYPEHMQFCLNYKLNEVTKPNVGKIFAFETLEQAIAFTDGAQVYTCVRFLEGTGKKSKYQYLARSANPHSEACLRGWWLVLSHRASEYVYPEDSQSLPPGTIFLDYFKPTKIR